MSYDQPSVPDFLEHDDGIPEVVLGGVQRAPACEKIVTLASACQPCPEEGCARGGWAASATDRGYSVKNAEGVSGGHKAEPVSKEMKGKDDEVEAPVLRRASPRRTLIVPSEMSFGLEDVVKALRWAAMVTITMILAGMAAASDEGTDARRQLTPQAQSEVGQSGTESAPAGSASQTQPPSALDRRDRIFYPGDTERPKTLIRKLFLN